MGEIDQIKENLDKNFKIKNKFSYKKFVFYTIFLVSVLIICIFTNYKKYKNIENIDTNLIYKNIFINNIDVSNLTYDEAIKKLEKDFSSPYKDNKITLVYKDDIYIYNFFQFNPYIDIKKAVNTAFDYTNKGTIKERCKKIKNLNKRPLLIDVDYKFNKEDIIKTIEEIPNRYNKEYTNPTMIKEKDSFIIKKGEVGYLVNIDELSEKIYKLLESKKEGEIKITLDTIFPKYDEKIFENADKLLGSFSTKFKPGAKGRTENINIASQKINGYVLYPEEVFSTNKILGSRIEKNGYKMAPVLIRGELIDDVGGGVCQISTNLYMAALFAELEIIERQNHSRKVSYADYGFDATLSYNYIDLKFKNNTEKAIYIESIVKNNISTINIYGEETRNPNRKIYFKNELVETVLPKITPIYEKDPLLLKGETIIKSDASPGYKYNLYKIVLENGVKVSKILINKSYYRPKPAIIKYGIS